MMEWFMLSVLLATGVCLGAAFGPMFLHWHPPSACSAYAKPPCQCCGQPATSRVWNRLATCAFCSERCRAPGKNSPDPNWYHDVIPPVARSEELASTFNYDPSRPLAIHFDFEPERPQVVAWPFPLINGVRMSHDEYHVEDPTAKCGMACVWYDEEERQGLA